MWSRVDEDSNGTVDFQEFLAKLVSTLSLQTNKIFFRFQKLYAPSYSYNQNPLEYITSGCGHCWRGHQRFKH